VGQHTLLHGETLLVVASADADHRISGHLSGHTLLIEGTFWQPVAGNEMFSCKRCNLLMNVYGHVEVNASCGRFQVTKQVDVAGSMSCEQHVIAQGIF
uniref:Uncharacterized protein n=1 Tax=Stegastes partitus TaxID=144197 RepID=A0A3B5BJ48_9TELE